MKSIDKPKTRHEIANELSLSYSTFSRWLKRMNLHLPRGLVFPADQERIYQHFYGKIKPVNKPQNNLIQDE